MTTSVSRKVFINLPVSDLKRSIAFFSALGFTFNPQFTDENAACMVFSSEAYAMLLTRPFFKTFTPREICDADRSEVLTAVALGSREEVDELADRALANGATPATEPKDHGFMYVRTFYDPDGHHWELFWLNPDTVQ